MTHSHTFLAITASGIARIARSQNLWHVETILADDVRCLAADPLHPPTVYAGTQSSGVLRSDDGGSAWRPAGLAGHALRAMAVSPIEPGVVFAGTRPPALYVTRDGGETWAELPGLRARRRFWWFSPAEPPKLTPYVMSIALSPSDPDLLLAGIELGGVLRSTDGGRTWSGHRRGAVLDCHNLVFHQAKNWAYEGGGGGAAASQDGGQSWYKPKDGLDRRYGWAVAADPAQPEIWYLSASGMPNFLRGEFVPPAHIDGQANAAIYRKTGGGPWKRLSGGLPHPLNDMAYALVTDPQAPGHLYAGMANGTIWHSTDHGDSWLKLPVDLGSLYKLVLLPSL